MASMGERMLSNRVNGRENAFESRQWARECFRITSMGERMLSNRVNGRENAFESRQWARECFRIASMGERMLSSGDKYSFSPGRINGLGRVTPLISGFFVVNLLGEPIFGCFLPV